MKKLVLICFFIGNILSFPNIENPFEDSNFDYVFKNISEIFSSDYKCKFIIKQEMLLSFHIDNKNEKMVENFKESLRTYGRIIQNSGEFEEIKDPIEVTARYYAKNCKIPEQKWLDYLNLPTFNKYFELIKQYKNN